MAQFPILNIEPLVRSSCPGSYARVYSWCARVEVTTLLLHVSLQCHPTGQRSVNVARGIRRNTFLRPVRIGIGNGCHDLAVFGATDRDAFSKSWVGLRVGLMVGQVERVVLVDEQPARPAELLPLFKKFPVLVEDLDAIVSAVTHKQPAARVHGQGVRCVELARRGSLLSPGFDELAILRKLHNTSVRISSMSVPNEDVAIRRDQDSGGLIECIRAGSGNSSLAERHQELALRTKLENLVALAVSVGIFTVRSFSVRHPHVSFSIDVDPMRTNEHPRTKALH